MKIYIDNVLLNFSTDHKILGAEKVSTVAFFELFQNEEFENYLIVDFDFAYFLERVHILLTKRPSHFVTVTLIVSSFNNIYDTFSDAFTPEPAAGGLVMKNDTFLMIKRLGKWDLPKGKMESDEETEDTAVREVWEECGVKVSSYGFLCDTFHMYFRKNKPFIKKTSWYLMECIEDRDMNGQEEEGITEVNWFNRKELETNLIHSYGNIEDVFMAYLQREKDLKNKE